MVGVIDEILQVLPPAKISTLIKKRSFINSLLINNMLHRAKNTCYNNVITKNVTVLLFSGENFLKYKFPTPIVKIGTPAFEVIFSALSKVMRLKVSIPVVIKMIAVRPSTSCKPVYSFSPALSL